MGAHVLIDDYIWVSIYKYVKHFFLFSLFDIEKDPLVFFPFLRKYVKHFSLFLQNPFRNAAYEINNIL